ncbi:unnamed protein product [Brassica rapa]|uniref:Uncharacterized protein n=1 Tax=Brassica campestris TaxID=3711 RepID=A0A8D9CQG8_BRACM|nr:unnamed protein product [Brassica rapa]
MKCRHKLIYRKLIMKRNHGLRKDYSKKKQLFQSLHLLTVFGPQTWLMNHGRAI